MISIRFFCILSCILIAQACKQNATTQQEEKPVVQQETTAPKTSAPTGGHDNNFLTDQMLHYKAAHIIGKDSKENPYANQWIDLQPDGTYKSGTLNTQTHTGKWGYNEESKVLLLQPDDPKFKTSEWKVMHSEIMLVWVGTQTYGDNATQVQLIRSSEFPK